MCSVSASAMCKLRASPAPGAVLPREQEGNVHSMDRIRSALHTSARELTDQRLRALQVNQKTVVHLHLLAPRIDLKQRGTDGARARGLYSCLRKAPGSVLGAGIGAVHYHGETVILGAHHH